MSLPGESELAGVAAFLFEVGTLKLTPRAGWAHAQVRNCESVAEHSHRAALIAAILAEMEGADPNRAALLGTLHDTQESRVGDVTRVGRRYVTAATNEQVTADHVAGAPPAVARMIAAAVAEFEAGATLEAQVAKDADRLECLIQALEYQHAGHRNAQPWIDSSRAGLKTTSAQRIADTAVGMTGLEWRGL